jgi:curved DNA-binding protein CbpA
MQRPVRPLSCGQPVSRQLQHPPEAPDDNTSYKDRYTSAESLLAGVKAQLAAEDAKVAAAKAAHHHQQQQTQQTLHGSRRATHARYEADSGTTCKHSPAKSQRTASEMADEIGASIGGPRPASRRRGLGAKACTWDARGAPPGAGYSREAKLRTNAFLRQEDTDEYAHNGADGPQLADPFLNVLAGAAREPEEAAAVKRAVRASRVAETSFTHGASCTRSARHHSRRDRQKRTDVIENPFSEDRAPTFSASSGSSGGRSFNKECGSGVNDSSTGGKRRGEKSRVATVRQGSRREREAGERVGSRVHHQRIAKEVQEKQRERRQRKREEAATHVGGWAHAHASIYDQLKSLPQIGPPLFPEAWTAGEVNRGDAKALRKAYHRAAARLHPDKVQALPLNAQALAEELFKALGEAYQKEVKRLNEGHTA